MRDSHSRLARPGLRVVAYDQLGTGRADRPDDPALWTIERYAREVEAVRTALDLGRVHLLGQSWGGWLAIEYAATRPEALKSLILCNTACDIPHLVGELDRLRAALGPETVAMMQRHEAMGTLDHPAYRAAITILDHRHLCRLDEWPAPLKRSMESLNMAVYGAMQGPNEFLYVGNLKDWSRERDLGRIGAPALVICGQHDELTPACAMKIARGLPDARVHVFPNSSHTPFFEEPEAYFAVLEGFLAARLGGGSGA
jgi:proline iminopeptidase